MSDVVADAWTTLGVAEAASMSQIRRAYYDRCGDCACQNSTSVTSSTPVFGLRLLLIGDSYLTMLVLSHALTTTRHTVQVAGVAPGPVVGPAPTATGAGG